MNQQTEKDLKKLVDAYFKERGGPEMEMMFAVFKARLMLELKICGNAHSGVVSGHLEYKATGVAVLSRSALETLNALEWGWENYLPKCLSSEIVEELIAAGAIVTTTIYDGHVVCNLTELGEALQEKSNAQRCKD